MKVYIIKEQDFESLLALVDRDPLHGADGGSSVASVRDKQQDDAHRAAHRFYNYQVRGWISQMKRD